MSPGPTNDCSQQSAQSTAHTPAPPSRNTTTVVYFPGSRLYDSNDAVLVVPPLWVANTDYSAFEKALHVVQRGILSDAWDKDPTCAYSKNTLTEGYVAALSESEFRATGAAIGQPDWLDRGPHGPLDLVLVDDYRYLVSLQEAAQSDTGQDSALFACTSTGNQFYDQPDNLEHLRSLVGVSVQDDGRSSKIVDREKAKPDWVTANGSLRPPPTSPPPPPESVWTKLSDALSSLGPLPH